MKVEIIPPPKAEATVVLTLTEREAATLKSAVWHQRYRAGNCAGFKDDCNRVFDALDNEGVRDWNY